MFCVHLQIESRRQTLSAQALKPAPCPLADRVPQADIECAGPEHPYGPGAADHGGARRSHGSQGKGGEYVGRGGFHGGGGQGKGVSVQGGHIDFIPRASCTGISTKASCPVDAARGDGCSAQYPFSLCWHRRRTGHRPSVRVLRSSRRRRSVSESLRPRGAPSLTGGPGAKHVLWDLGHWDCTPRCRYLILLGRQTWAAQNTPLSLLLASGWRC